MDQSPADKITLSILAAVSFSVLVWDHCLLLPVEYQVYLGMKKYWKDPRPWSFILLRYTGLAALLANVFMSSVRHEHCQLASNVFRAFYVLLMVIFCTLVTLRVSSIWKYHPDVVSALAFLGLTVIGLWIAVATRTKAFSQPSTLLGSNCALQPFPSWFSSTYAAALAFNLAAFGLAFMDILAKPSDADGDKRRDLRLLTYLVVCVAASAAILVIAALGYDQQVNKQAASGIFILLIVSMGSRIHLTFGVTELNTPLLSSSQQASQSLSFPSLSWRQDSSTINQSGMSFVGSSTSKVVTTISSPSIRGTSIGTSYSHMSPFEASRSLPQPHHNPSISATSAGSSSHSSSPPPRGGVPSPESQSRTPHSTAPMTPQTSVSTSTFNSPILFRGAEPLPTIPTAINPQPTNRNVKHGAPSNRDMRSTSRSPGKRHRKLSDMQSGWIDS